MKTAVRPRSTYIVSFGSEEADEDEVFDSLAQARAWVKDNLFIGTFYRIVKVSERQIMSGVR